MRSLAHINKYFLKYKWRFVSGIFFVIISNIFAIYPAQIIGHAFDIVREAILAHSLFEGFDKQKEFYDLIAKALLFFGVAVLALALLKGLFMFFMRQTLIVMSRMIEYDLKNEIYDQYQRLDMSFYKINSTGDLMNRISEDVSRVRMYIGPAIMYTINLIILFALVIATMLSVNPKLTLIVLIPLPVLSFTIYRVSSIINKKSEVVQRHLSRLSTFAQETFAGIRVLKAYTREHHFSDEFEKESNLYKDKAVELMKVNALFHPFMILLIGLSTLLTIYVGGIEAINGNITTGNIAEFVIYVNMLTWPVASLGWVTSIIQQAAASQTRINEFLKHKPEIINPAINFTEVFGNIEFKNVSFVYPDSGIMALNNISFNVNSGSSLAILGKTGAGKSTVAHLISRFYDANDGEVLIDGEPIKSVNLDSLRNAIGYVPQDVFLFSDTISNNIAFGIDGNYKNEMEKKDMIFQAAKDAVIFDNITEFPKGFETMLGERGITLSGGQKQRISIARAIIRNPRILVFDDCLSAVDTETEEMILANLKRAMKEKTTIIISHRVSSVKHADNIIVIDKGAIIEEGSHLSLMEKHGAYFALYQKQLLEEAIAGG